MFNDIKKTDLGCHNVMFGLKILSNILNINNIIIYSQ